MACLRKKPLEDSPGVIWLVLTLIGTGANITCIADIQGILFWTIGDRTIGDK